MTKKEYEPIPVYNRKLARSVLKAKLEKRDGFHRTNDKLAEYFAKYKNLINNNN